MNEPKVVLTHCHSAWGLPTYDPRCLEIMLFLHVCKVKWEAVESNYAYSPHSGCYPHLRVDNKVAGSEWYPDLLASLKPECTMNQQADKVMVWYVRKRLSLVNDFCFWRDEVNKVYFAKEFKSRLSIFYHFKAHLFNSRRNEVDTALEKNNIRSREAAIEVLKECLHLLEERLATSDTFYNNGLSELDCAVGAQLLVMKHHKLPSNYINLDDNSCLLADKYPRLSEFLKKILRTTEDLKKTLKQGEEKIEENEVPRFIRPQRREPAGKERSREDQEADQKSRMFLLGCFLTVVAYCYIFKPVQIEVEAE